MPIRRRPAATTLAATSLVLALLAPVAGAKPPLRIPLPSAGQSTIAVAQLRFKGEAPRGVRVKLKNRAGLGHATRGLYAIYRKRKGRATVFTVFNLILRQGGAAGDRLTSASSSNESGYTHMVFFFLAAGFRDDSVFEDHDASTNTAFNLLAEVTGHKSSTRPPRPMQILLDLGGVEEPPASNPADLGESLVDTGHYDDGHSFGWNSAGTKKALGDWLRLSADNAPYEELIEKIERDLSADLDEDGNVGGGAGGTVDTEVGPPVIH